MIAGTTWGRAVLLGLVLLVVGACGGADDDPEPSSAPTVPVLDVVVTGDVATLVANVVAPDGDLDMVTVDWGDGVSDTVTSGFPGVRLDHTYTADGEFTIVLEAHGAADQSVIATTVASITAFAAAADDAPATTDDDADDEGSDGGGSSEGSNGGGGAGGGGSEPPPAPAPSPEPAPEPEPEPIPEPVTVDLRDDEVIVTVRASRPDDAGGSAEAVQQGPHSFGLRSYAWHGYGGFSTADGILDRVVDATPVLADMPEQVTAVLAEVSYELELAAEVKGPHDRYSFFDLAVSLSPGGQGRVLAKLAVTSDDADPIARVSDRRHTATLTQTLTRDEPVTNFRLEAKCTSRGGHRALAFFNEGYCDALEQGGITLRGLTVTYIPIIED